MPVSYARFLRDSLLILQYKKMNSSDQFPFSDKLDWNSKVFLGEGSYGRVFKVKQRQDGQMVAVKQIKMDEFNREPSLMASLKGEINVTMDVNSPYTVKMIDYRIGKRFTYMILELCDSDLRKELATRKFQEEEAVKVFEEIMFGFEVLVGKGYIHRDVKPANVLVKSKHYKVADFGFACKADILGRKKLNEICGTPIYMAPQLLSSQAYTAKSDIWSLGLMLYEMVFGFLPWPCRTLDEYTRSIRNRPLTFPYDAKIGANTKDFIIRSLVVDEERRIGWKEVFAHPLIKHKETGQDITPVKISEYLKKILAKLQADIKKKSLNLRNLMDKYKTDKMTLAQFTAFLREIDLTITTHEAKALFDHLDKHKEGALRWEWVEEGIAKVDYRNTDNILERKLDDLAAIINDRQQDPNVLFNRIDTNHSGAIDWAEFCKFISQIGPCYTKQEILQLFKLMDTDHSGLISKSEFQQFLTARLPSGHHAPVQQARASRNLNNLVSYIKWSGISTNTILKIADTNHDSVIDLGEFKVLVGKLNFNVTDEEIKEMFDRISKNGDNKITNNQLMEVLK